MTRPRRTASGFAARHSVHAIGVDAGIDTVKLWLPEDGPADVLTPIGAAHRLTRNDATAAIINASGHGIRRRIPRGLRRRRRGFRVAATVPACASRAARRRVEAALRELNRTQPVLLMDAPLAAAAGAGIDIAGTVPRVVLDVGVHGSEAAVVAEGRILDVASCPAGCHDVERAVIAHLYRRHHLLATPEAARRALTNGATTVTDPGTDTVVVVRLRLAELAAEISDPIAAIVETVRQLTRRTTVTVDRDPLDNGVLLVGGGALLPQLARTLRDELRTEVHIPPDPRHASARGVGQLVAMAERYPQLWAD